MKVYNTGQKMAYDCLNVPWWEIPAWRSQKAMEKGHNKDLLLVTWGGIGDVISSIPTVRYAAEKFKDCQVTVATLFPELFEHIPEIHDIYDLKKEKPVVDDYLKFELIPNQEGGRLIDQFITHMHTHCVNFPCLAAFRCELPLAEREVTLRPKTPTLDRPVMKIFNQAGKNFVPVHCGRHWESKTFPSAWWTAVLKGLIDNGMTPILIGADGGESQGYVEVDAGGCLDLRDKTTIMESVWLLQQAPVVVCNDSSPLHMAVTGKAFIGLISTVKRPEFVMHYRRPTPGTDLVFGWRQKEFGLGGMWQIKDINPNTHVEVTMDKCEPGLIESFLPDPSVFGPWCKEKANEYYAGI